MFYYLVNMYYCFCVLSYREARGFEVRGGIAVAKCRVAAVIATSIFRRGDKGTTFFAYPQV